jgi:glutathione synthase/RimK-type ligase-like ATP-grasp enzyme
VILVWGSADDPPTERILERLRERAVDVVHVDHGVLASLAYDVVLAPHPTGWLRIHGREVSVDDIAAVYLRPGDVLGSPAAAAAARALMAVVSSGAATVVNRPASGRSNWSKPFHLGAIAAAGFAVPETLVTTDPTAARAFLAHHGRLVYKSVSGVRSIVATLDSGDTERLDGVRTGPVQLQRWIDGLDVRVHVVGDRWFATAVDCDAPDYRYAPLVGEDVAMAPCSVPDEIGLRLVALSRTLGLLVSGADLRLTPDGDWVCFEVNPSPGFTFYEDETGQPIAAAIADLLVGDPPA